MLKRGLGIALLMAFSVSPGSGNEINIAALDWKQADHIVTWQSQLDESDPGARKVVGSETGEEYVLSESIMFTEQFDQIAYGDVIGSMEVEFTNIDCDIIYAQNRADAMERGEQPGGEEYVYLFYEEGGKGLNASYMNFYAPQKLMPDYDTVDAAGDIHTRYLHAWIRVGGEELQMDLSGMYYSDEMGTGHGVMIGLTEPDLLPPDVKSDEEKIGYIGSCLNEMPEGIEYDRMITICSYDTDYKRIIIAVNLAE